MGTENVILRNNTGNKQKSALIDGFVVRTALFEDIAGQLQKSKLGKVGNNFLIVGQRGSGKTTLLYRIKYLIEDNTSLNKWIIPIMFTEEQYGIISLENLWEAVAEYMEEQWDAIGLAQNIEKKYVADKSYEISAWEILEAWLAKNQKRIILFIENINSFFKKIDKEGQQRIKYILTTSKYISLIGSSTTFFDSSINYTETAYDYLQIHQLEGLSKEETETLLFRIGQQHHAEAEIKKIIDEHPNRIESLRRLTGGVPRTISYLFQIFMDNENGKAIKDLYQLLDNLSLLYKAEIDQLSAQQQKIIDTIAKKWEYISVKEIAEKTRMESKHISAILSQLNKNQTIDIIQTELKNHLYGIKDRFMNIWYLMRFGKKSEKEKVLWLVRFYDIWCDKTELAKRISNHLSSLKTGQYDESAAISMSHTFMACENIDPDLKYSIYKETKSFLPSELKQSINIPDSEIYEMIKSLIDKGELVKAEDMLSTTSEKNKDYYFNEALLNIAKKQFDLGVESLKHLYSFTGDATTANAIGEMYERYLKNYTEAKAFYTIALRKKNYFSAHRLGHLYSDRFNDYGKGAKYFKIAIDHGIQSAILCYAEMLVKKGDHKHAIEYFTKAITEKVENAHSAFGTYYFYEGDYEAAIKEFDAGILKPDDRLLKNYGRSLLLKENPDPSRARTFFQKLIDNKNAEGYYQLGMMFKEHSKNYKKAEKNLLLADSRGIKKASHDLAHLYVRLNQYDNSIKYFKKSVESGFYPALICFAYSIFGNHKNDYKFTVYEYLTQKRKELNELGIVGNVTYALMQLWNHELEDSLLTLKNQNLEILKILNEGTEDDVSELTNLLLTYFLLLISRGKFEEAMNLFENKFMIEIPFKDILKPVYFALKKLLKVDKKLQIPAELKETVDELILKINDFKKQYN